MQECPIVMFSSSKGEVLNVLTSRVQLPGGRNLEITCDFTIIEMFFGRNLHYVVWFSTLLFLQLPVNLYQYIYAENRYLSLVYLSGYTLTTYY